MFHKESISGFHDFKQKSGHRTNSWSEWGKNLTKICQNVLYSYTKTQPNTNTTPLVSLDNSSTLTISDLFVAHSCFQPVDPKNGLKLFFLLSLCSFWAGFKSWFICWKNEYILTYLSGCTFTTAWRFATLWKKSPTLFFGKPSKALLC